MPVNTLPCRDRLHPNTSSYIQSRSDQSYNLLHPVTVKPILQPITSSVLGGGLALNQYRRVYLAVALTTYLVMVGSLLLAVPGVLGFNVGVL